MKKFIFTIFVILLSTQVFAADRLVYDCPGNPVNVCIEIFAPEYLDNGGTIAEIKTEREAQGLTVARVQESKIPSDRTFRNAWAFGAGKIDVDMPRARVIHRARMEVIKNREQAVLRQEIIGLELFGKSATGERAVHVALDTAITNLDMAINSAQNPTALKNIWPPLLPTE